MIICQKRKQLHRVWHCRDCREAPKGYPIKQTEEFHRAATEIDERRSLDSDRRVLNISRGSIPARWPVPEKGFKMPRKCLGLWRGRPSPDPFSPNRETTIIILYTGVREILEKDKEKILFFINVTSSYLL